MDIKKLNATLKDLNKIYDEDIFIRLGKTKTGAFDIKRVSSGRLSIDIPFGGGIPNGKIIELYGKESSGKTTISLHCTAAFQKEIPSRAVAFIDYEHAFDIKYAKSLGVDVDNLVFAQPTYAEQGLSGVDRLIDTGQFSLIVVDSVAAMVPKAELEGDMDKSSIGVHARLMSKAMRKLVGKANTHSTTIIFINQMREKIGVMYGSPWVTTGGNALKFYASIRAEVRRGTKNKDKNEQITGNRGKLVVVKNKTASPYAESAYDIEFGIGISKEGEILDYGIDSGLIKKGGSWYSYGDTKLGQGRENAKRLLRDNPELVKELTDKILELIDN